MEDLAINREDQDLYEDLVFLARNNNELNEESPDTAEYFARVLQSTDRITDLHDKKSLLKDKIHELLLVDEADNPDAIITATRHDAYEPTDK